MRRKTKPKNAFLFKAKAPDRVRHAEGVTLKCVKDSFSGKGLLFPKRTYFCEKDFFMAKTIY